MADDTIEVEKYVRWETPVSDAKSLGMVTLVQDNHKLELKIILEDPRDPERKRCALIFENVAAYKNVLEEYRLCEWGDKNSTRTNTGWTQIVEDSNWLKYFSKNEPLLEVHHEGAVHYKILTDDDVIDIVTNKVPEIQSLEPAKKDDPAPGQSQILYHPEDRKEIDKIITEAKGNVSDA